MKKNLISLLLCIAICMTMIPSVSAVQECERTKISSDEIAALSAADLQDDLVQPLQATLSDPIDTPTSAATRSSNINTIMPHITTLYQAAVVGETMKLNFSLFSSGDSTQRYDIQIYYGSSAATDTLVGYSSNNYNRAIGVTNLTLYWNTTGNYTGTYTVYCYTTNSSGDIYSDTIEAFTVYLYSYAKPINRFFLFTDSYDSPVSSMTLQMGAEDFVYVGYDPIDTTDDKSFTISNSNKSCVDASTLCGFIDLTAVKPGVTRISVYGDIYGTISSHLRVLVPDTVSYPVSGGNIYFDPSTGAITGSDAGIAAANIPSTINGVAVTSIADHAFFGCYNLKSVVIPEGIVRIGMYAFSYCANLKSVVISESVRMIDDYAFFDCTSLEGVYFLGDTPNFGFYVFQDWYYCNIPGLTLYYLEGKEDWTWSDYPTATWNGFVDVSSDAWYAGAVDYIVENALMNGMGNYQFRPESSMTRALLVTVLWRYAGSPEAGTSSFGDLEQDWYKQAVAWAAENGIVTGYPDGTFKPDDEVTREQLATIIYRYCNSVGIDTDAAADLSAFPDADNVNAYALAPISWAVSVGLITGITHGGNPTAYLEPQTSATRAQVATILMRFIENVA